MIPGGVNAAERDRWHSVYPRSLDGRGAAPGAGRGVGGAIALGRADRYRAFGEGGCPVLPMPESKASGPHVLPVAALAPPVGLTREDLRSPLRTPRPDHGRVTARRRWCAGGQRPGLDRSGAACRRGRRRRPAGDSVLSWRRVRRRLRLSQTDFARRIDVPHKTVRNWERGEGLPDRRGARPVASARQSSPDRVAGADLKGRSPRTALAAGAFSAWVEAWDTEVVAAAKCSGYSGLRRE